jgi:hypothetical protein
VKIAVSNNPATSGRILGGVVFMLILPFPCNPELPKGLELCCPAEAGCPPSILAHASGPGAPGHHLARRRGRQATFNAGDMCPPGTRS